MIYSKSLQYFISIPAFKLHTGAFLSFHLTQEGDKGACHHQNDADHWR